MLTCVKWFAHVSCYYVLCMFVFEAGYCDCVYVYLTSVIICVKHNMCHNRMLGL